MHFRNAGVIDGEMNFKPTPVPVAEVSATAPTEAFTVGEFQFTKRTEVVQPAVKTEMPRTDIEAEAEKAEPSTTPTRGSDE